MNRKILLKALALLACMLCTLSAAAAEAYAVYTASNTTLTFYFDNLKNSRTGTKYSLNTGDNNPDWYRDNTCQSITRVVFDSSFAGARPTTTYGWFSDMENLQSISGTQYFNTIETTNMKYMFSGAGSSSVSINLSFLKTDNVKYMTGMFCNCFFKSVDVSGWNTANVEDMKEMFGWCYNMTSLNLSHFNTAKVTNMEGMFIESSHLETINVSGWNTANVTDMSLMFRECNALKNVDVSSFNTAKVTNMDRMFECCEKLQSLNVSNFNTAKVTDMEGMFSGCKILTSLNVSNFNTANVTTMESMFNSCSNLTSLNVSNFNTAKVTTMYAMFASCNGLTTLDLSNFNTAKVTWMQYMFYNCSNLTTIYAGSGWSTAAVTYSSDMFKNCTKIKGGKGTTYNASHIDKAYAHIDGGTSNPGYLTELVPEAYACYTSSNNTLTFYYDKLRNTRTGTTYDLNTGNNNPDWYKDDTKRSVKYVVFNSTFASVRPTTTYCWFADMENLQSISGTQYLNTSEVTNMAYMFSGTGGSSMTSLNTSFLNTSNVTSMKGMFSYSNFTTINVSSLNTAKVTNMNEMFAWCYNLKNLDLSSFNTSKVTDMSSMFNESTHLETINTSGWNTANVTNMQCLFRECNALKNVDVSSFNTAKVTDIGCMFEYCEKLQSLDLSSFNTAKVTDMCYMFSGCKELVTIYVGTGWSTSATTDYDSRGMFQGCTKIRGEKGTTYNSSHTDKAYAHIDGGTSNPGYLSGKKEAYAVYTSSNTTLTFYYDSQRSSRTGTTYSLNTGTNSPDWYRDETYKSVTKVVFNSSFAEARPTTAYMWFYNMTKLQSITGINYLNTSEVTSMNSMFLNCSKLTSINLNNFNTAKVTTMANMFYGCNGLTVLDLSHFNTAKVTSMVHMFYFCSNLTTIYAGSGWNTDGVTSSTDMFRSCTKIQGSMGTAYDANHLDKAYAHIDGGVSNPGYLSDFSEAYAVYTSSNKKLTFYYDTQRSSRTGITYNLNTGSTYPEWFDDGTYYSVIEVVFDPSFANARPTTTYMWFNGMTSLNNVSDINYFNTSEVTNMASMFTGCNSLKTLDLSHFNTAKVTNMASMFYNCSALTTIFAGSDWSTAAVTSSTEMFRNCTKIKGSKGTTYNSSHIDKAYAHIDGGTSNPGYLSEAMEAYAVYTASSKTLTFYYDNNRSSRSGTTYDLNTGTNNPAWRADGTSASVTRVIFNSSFKDALPKTTFRWFNEMANLQSITGMQYFNTSDVTTMSYMFAACGLESIDLSTLNTSKVNTMSSMFYNCTNLKSVNLSSFNTENVTTMSYMFSGCTKLEKLDLGKFNTENVTNMSSMFSGDTKLVTIFAGSNWNTDAVTSSSSMFRNCTMIKGGKGTTYDANHVDKAYAHIDGGKSNPGYLTNALKGDVNCDGEVTVADINEVINAILSGSHNPLADVNADGEINIADVNEVIDIILG